MGEREGEGNKIKINIKKRDRRIYPGGPLYDDDGGGGSSGDAG